MTPEKYRSQLEHAAYRLLNRNLKRRKKADWIDGVVDFLRTADTVIAAVEARTVSPFGTQICPLHGTYLGACPVCRITGEVALRMGRARQSRGREL